MKINNTRSWMTVIALLLGYSLGVGTLWSDEITTPSYFGGNATTINFDQFGHREPLIGFIQGAHFRSESESHINYPDYTDQADVNGRFDTVMRALAAVEGGGAPVSQLRYASGMIHGDPDNQWGTGRNVSDMRIDFAIPQSAAAMWFIDNDFSTVRLRAYNDDSQLLETVVIPETTEGGITYRGISRLIADISYLIIDEAAGGNMDSTFIDDFTFLPEPATFTLFALGGLALLKRSGK